MKWFLVIYAIVVVFLMGIVAWVYRGPEVVNYIVALVLFPMVMGLIVSETAFMLYDWWHKR